MAVPAPSSQDPFHRLLQWLAPDPEAAAERYKQIHQRLTTLFVCKGCNCAEELADKVMDRVAQKVDEMPAMSADEQARVFFSFSKFIYLEYRRTTMPIAVFSDWLDQPQTLDEAEKQEHCLDLCLDKLDGADRDLLLGYYEFETGQKIRHRKMIAARLQMAMNALRIKVCRLRRAVELCLLPCVQSGNAGVVASD